MPSVVMLTTDAKIDRRIIQEAESLKKAGWDTKILALDRQQADEPDSTDVERLSTSMQKETKSGSLQITFLNLYRWAVRVLPFGGLLRRLAGKIIWRFIYDCEKFYLDLFDPAVRKYSPTVFLAHDLPMLPVAINAARQSGAKVVYDSHELYAEQEFTSYERKRWREIEDKYIRDCNEIITVNQPIADELQSRYRLPKPVNVIYNGVERNPELKKGTLFHQIYNLPKESKIVLLQGGLSSNRNLDNLVSAFLHVSDPTIYLVILGGGEHREALIGRAKKLGINHRVLFHEEVKQDKLLSYTVNADLGIIPYQATCLNNYYCTPNKLFEFIASGVPVLASNLPAIDDIVTKYRIGVTADLSTPENIASSIECYFANSDLHQEYVENIKRAQSDLCWNNDQIIKIFEPLRS